MLDTVSPRDEYLELRGKPDEANIEDALVSVLKEQRHHEFRDALKQLLEIDEVKVYARENPQQYLRNVIGSICNGQFRGNNNMDLYTDLFDWFMDSKFTQKLIAQDPLRSAFTMNAVIPYFQSGYISGFRLPLHVGVSPVFGGEWEYAANPHYLIVKRPTDERMKFVEKSPAWDASKNRDDWKSGRRDFTVHIESLSSRRNEVNGDKLKSLFGNLARLQGELILASQDMSHLLKDRELQARVLEHFDAWYAQAGEAMEQIRGSWYIGGDMRPGARPEKHIPML